MTGGDVVIYRCEHPYESIPRFGVGRIRPEVAAKGLNPSTTWTIDVLIDAEGVYWPDAEPFSLTVAQKDRCVPFVDTVWADLAWDSRQAYKLTRDLKTRWDDLKWRYRDA